MNGNKRHMNSTAFSRRREDVLPIALVLRWILGAWLILSSGSVPARTLEDLLYQAMQSYPTILAQMQTRSAAETDVTASMLRFLPNPTVNTQQNQVSYSGRPTTSQPAANFSVSQPIWMGGALVAGYNKADAKLNAADYGVLESRQEVSRKLITAYAEWVKAYLKIIALEESVKLHERFVEMITNRFQTGVAPQTDRDLGQSRLLQAQAELDTQRSLEWTSLTTLSQLVGDPVKRVELEGAIAKPASVSNREEALDVALHINPAIQRLNFEADAAEEEAKEVRAKALPQVSFHAEHQMNNAIIPGAPGYDAYGLVVSYSPDGGFASVASASAAFTRAEAARTQVETSKRDLMDRLNADFNEYEFSRLKQESLKHSVSLATDISESYDRQYLVGRKSWLDLMNMVRERAQNRVQLADAEGGLIGASHRLLVYVEGTSAFDITPKPHGSECDGAEECAREWDKIKQHPRKMAAQDALPKGTPVTQGSEAPPKVESIPQSPHPPLQTKLLIPETKPSVESEDEDPEYALSAKTETRSPETMATLKGEPHPAGPLVSSSAVTPTPIPSPKATKADIPSVSPPKARLSLQEEVERALNSRLEGKGERVSSRSQTKSEDGPQAPVLIDASPPARGRGSSDPHRNNLVPASPSPDPNSSMESLNRVESSVRKIPPDQTASMEPRNLSETVREKPNDTQAETRRMMQSIADSLNEIDRQLK